MEVFRRFVLWLEIALLHALRKLIRCLRILQNTLHFPEQVLALLLPFRIC